MNMVKSCFVKSCNNEGFNIRGILFVSDDFIDYPSLIVDRYLYRTARTPVPQQYTTIGVSQTDIHFGNNKIEKIYEKSENKDALPTKIDVPKIINRIISNKRFAAASVIYIVTCDDEEDRGSCNVDICSMQSSECYVPVKSVRQVDPGVDFFCLSVMRMASASLSCLCDCMETSHYFCNRGRSQRQKSPTSPPPGILKLPSNRSVKVQKPSIGSIRFEDETAVKADELNVTSNRSVKVQKPSIESIRHEGGIAPEKLPDIGWLLKSPAKDPNEPKDLESPNSSKLKKANIEKMQKWESKAQPMPGLQPQNQQVVKLTEEGLPEPEKLAEVTTLPQKLVSAKSAKQKEEETVCRCKKNKSMTPKEPVKLAEVTPVPQKLASDKTAKQKDEGIVCMCKTDKLMSPEEPGKLAELTPVPQKLASAKTAKQKKGETVCMCKNGKLMSPEEPGKLAEVIPLPEKIESTKTAKQKAEKRACMCKNKSMSPEEPEKLAEVTPGPQKLESTKTAKQKAEKRACMCKNKSMSPEEPEKLAEVTPGPQKLESTETAKQKAEKRVCMCKNKSMSPEEPEKLAEVTPGPQKLESTETAKQKEEETVSMLKNDKLMNPKEPEKLAEVTPVPQKLKSTETAKQKEEETVSILKNDKLMSPKEPEKLAEVTLVPQKGLLSYLKLLMSPKQLESPKELESQKSSNRTSRLFTKIKKYIFNEFLKNQIGQQAPSKLKDKDLQSLKTGEQKEGKATCECKEDKPMSPKASTTPITRHPPLLPPVLLGPVEITPEGKFYEVIGPSCKWVDKAEIKSLRSQLTRSTSGFTVSKRKKIVQSQSEDSIELDFGDAIRYFASMNPKRFQQLMQEELEDQLDEQKKYEGKEGKRLKKKMEKEKKKLEKAQRKAEKKAKITTDSPDETFESSDESECQYPKGFKLSIGVKGKAKAKAFDGWDCTDILDI